MNKSQLDLLKDIYSLLTPNNTVNAVYIPPAQALRNRADEMERQERLLNQFKRELVFWETGGYPQETECTIISGGLTDFTTTTGTTSIKI